MTFRPGHSGHRGLFHGLNFTRGAAVENRVGSLLDSSRIGSVSGLRRRTCFIVLKFRSHLGDEAALFFKRLNAPRGRYFRGILLMLHLVFVNSNNILILGSH